MKNIPKYLSNLTLDKTEVLERMKYFENSQHELRKVVNSYENSNDAPASIRRQIYENKILLNNYGERIKELNKKIRIASLNWNKEK